MLRPEVRHIFGLGKPMNFKLGTQTSAVTSKVEGHGRKVT